MNFLEHEFNVSEIFCSIQGEGSRAGLRCVFIRLQGCNLRCKWCDTSYALEINETAQLITGQKIIEKIKEFNCELIEFTGGEPLVQRMLIPFMTHLCDLNYQVMLETNGSYLLDGIDKRVIKIIDMKCPGSGTEKSNKYEILNKLNKNDEIKFVIADRIDYEWAKNIINKYGLNKLKNEILFSSVFESLAPVELVEWILEDKLDIRFQLQLHKFIWDPSKRGV